MLAWVALIILTLLLFWRVKAFRDRDMAPWEMFGLFILKFLAALFLTYLYTDVMQKERERTDVFKYFDDGAVMASTWHESPELFTALFLDRDASGTEVYYSEMDHWNRSYDLIRLNDNRTMIRIHALIHLFSKGSYAFHCWIFALSAFIGLYLLYLSFRDLGELPKWSFPALFILPPSLLLWVGPPLKESWALLAMGLTIYGLFKLRKGRGWVAFLFGLLLFMGIKPYLLMAILPFMFLFILLYFTPIREWVAALVSNVGFLMAMLLSGLHPKTDVIGVLALKQKDFINLGIERAAGSMVDIPLFTDGLSFLAVAPYGIWNTLARPYPSFSDGLLSSLSGIEQSVYLLLIALAIALRRSNIRWGVVYMCLTYYLWTAIFVGSVTPIMGALVRYRAPVIPFLLIAVICVLEPGRIVDWRQSAGQKA